MNQDLRQALDDKYINIVLNRIQICQEYKPATGKQVSLQEFQSLYGDDPFYAWFGLNSPLVYAAHRAAGGITSVYRQIGLGCEELFRQILQDCLGLNESQVRWSYETSSPDGRKHRLALDGCITLADLQDQSRQATLCRWMRQVTYQIDVAPEIAQVLKGIVFEVRQGYKSKDSKRQNADLANAAMAYSQGYLPVLLILSTQVDSDIVERYEQAKWLILRGYLSSLPTGSTWAFMDQIIGYDLATFFQRNAPAFQATMTRTLHTLLEVAVDGR